MIGSPLRASLLCCACAVHAECERSAGHGQVIVGPVGEHATRPRKRDVSPVRQAEIEGPPPDDYGADTCAQLVSDVDVARVRCVPLEHRFMQQLAVFAKGPAEPPEDQGDP